MCATVVDMVAVDDDDVDLVTADLAEQTFDADTASIADARRFVRRCLAMSAIDVDRRSDVELVASELVTNAVENGAGHPVTVSMQTGANGITLSISGARPSGTFGDPSTWVGPVPAARRGRGLSIVRAVSDNVTVDVSSSRLTVSCEFSAAVS